MKKLVLMGALAAFWSCDSAEIDTEAVPIEVVPLMDIAAERRAATTAVFSDEVDPEEVLASVGEHSVRAADVAAYLRIYPSLSVEQAAEDLIDTHIAQSLDFEAQEFDIHDARVRGRVIAWLRSQAWENEAVDVPDPAAVAEMLGDPANRTAFGTPELVTASHVLLNAEGEEQTPEREAAAAEFAAQVRAELADLGRPVQGADLIRAAYQVIPGDEPVVEGMTLIADAALVFPREYAGAPNWNGIEAVVPEFGEAAFEAELNEVVGPVRSDYGWHVIVVETKLAEDFPDEAEMQRMAEERQVGHQRGEVLQQAVHRVILESQVVLFEENIALMALSADERVQLQAGENRERFRN